MDRIEPTRKIALRLWWAFVWRSVLFAVGAGFSVGLVLGLLGALLKLTPDRMASVSGFLGVILGAGLSVEAMYRVLRKKYPDFEIALLPRCDD